MSQSGSDKAAIAWIIAKNVEEENNFIEQKQAYKEGIIDGQDLNDGDITITDDVTENIPVPPSSIDIGVDSDGSGESNSDGIQSDIGKRGWIYCGENSSYGKYSVRIWIDYGIGAVFDYYPNTTTDSGHESTCIKKGVFKVDVYSENDGLVKSVSFPGGIKSSADITTNGNDLMYNFIKSREWATLKMNWYQQLRTITNLHLAKSPLDCYLVLKTSRTILETGSYSEYTSTVRTIGDIIGSEILSLIFAANQRTTIIPDYVNIQ